MTEVSPETRAAIERQNRILDRILGAAYGRAPRWQRFRVPRGAPWFFWTLEPYDEDGDPNGRFGGRYVSGVYMPIGKGSRSGKASTWMLQEDSLSGARTKREARARALRLLNRWRDGNRRPWA